MKADRWDGVEPFKEWMQRQLQAEREAKMKKLRRQRAAAARRRAEAREGSQP